MNVVFKAMKDALLQIGKTVEDVSGGLPFCLSCGRQVLSSGGVSHPLASTSFCKFDCNGSVARLALLAIERRSSFAADDGLVERLAHMGMHVDDIVLNNSVLMGGRRQGVRSLLRAMDEEIFGPVDT